MAQWPGRRRQEERLGVVTYLVEIPFSHIIGFFFRETCSEAKINNTLA